jgi:hypothetical protein
VEIRIEDGYWNRSDAAVVFQHVDKRNGNVRYIYHGNDGTHMPWNDTAQLDFLKAEVRESVIQTILHVARKCSIIRFDAAMTLTKRHFQRLWYPQPGSGGDIPSRADHALATKEFNKFFPKEFWREVVDRINHEMPQTLLLAEAFWLLEGYFVRTLGMHRVYNSAFMHMMMKEENSKYRELIRNTMHYNPEILKRYVNFMSNPDEQTAIAQFGKDDKYFGVALLMVTLPGLPMFGHGQVEGYHEKYGMEYKRAYYDEEPDTNLVSRHEREIFPLLGKRYLFSQVTFFEMYDFFDTHGNLNENVFAYSNKSGNERALVCYHNKYAETVGWIKNSVGRNTGSTDHPNIIHRSLAEALEFSHDSNVYYIFKDFSSKLEFIRSGRELHENGIYVELKAFGYHIFLDFREIYDSTGEYAELARYLNGGGVYDMQEEFQMRQLLPVHLKLFDLINKEKLEMFRNYFVPSDQKLDFPSEIVNCYEEFLKQLAVKLNIELHFDDVRKEFGSKLKAVQRYSLIKNKLQDELFAVNFHDGNDLAILYSYLILSSLEITDKEAIFDKMKLWKVLENILRNLQLKKIDIEESVGLLKVLISDIGLSADENIFGQEKVKEFLKVNEHEGVQYFNKQRFEVLVWWLFTISILEHDKITLTEINYSSNKLQKILKASEESGYKFEELNRAKNKESKNIF